MAVFWYISQIKTKLLTVRDYIKQLQSYEEYGFSWEELIENSNSPTDTLRKEIDRLAKGNELIKLRQGFFLIVPPRYSNLGKIPLQLYVDKLFKYLGKPYYVGLFTASAIHGASHQKIQKEYIITTPPALIGINKNLIKIEFLSTKSWEEKSIRKEKSDAGFYNVSSPALTALDMLNYHQKLGGINRILANLEELAEEITVEDLDKLLSWYPNVSAIQRLGFVLDELQVEKEITDNIFKHLKERKYYSVLLANKKGEKAGTTGNRWRVDVNIELDNDL
jgi:predicted transcriptional regulator of viral defense system